MYNFSVGNLYATPVGGGAPVKFAALQDVTIDFSGDIKELFGQDQFPIAVARGKTKIEVKAAVGLFNVQLFNQLFFGETVTTGEMLSAVGENLAIPATPGPYTATVANSANFFADMGVVYADTGVALQQVASAPAAGQYSVAAGVYTFAAADQGKHVLVDYIYKSTSTGNTLTINNQLMGTTPKFALMLSDKNSDGDTLTMWFYEAVCAKLGFPLKLDDFTMPSLEFSIQQNAAGQIGFMTTSH